MLNNSSLKSQALVLMKRLLSPFDRAVVAHHTHGSGPLYWEDCYALHSRDYSNHLSPGWDCAL